MFNFKGDGVVRAMYNTDDKASSGSPSQLFQYGIAEKMAFVPVDEEHHP